MNEGQTMAALPQYQCHKKVWALKVKQVLVHDPAGGDPGVEFAGGHLIFEDERYAPRPFDAKFWERHKPKDGDYWVQYEDGYQSMSPAAAFENGYTLISSGLPFGTAIEALKAGKRVCRAGWEAKGLFVFMQVPASIPADVQPKMQSLPDTVKAEFARRDQAIHYSNQLALVKPNNRINGWAPSASDALATDWLILD
jgi:hypothetical protein